MSTTAINTNQQLLSQINTTGTQTASSGGTVNSASKSNDGDQDDIRATSNKHSSTTYISRPAQFITNLKQLQAQDPAKFKQELTDAADKLKEAAKNSTGDEQKFLNHLADRFIQASNGNFSGFSPDRKPGNSGTVRGAYQSSAQASGTDLVQSAITNFASGAQTQAHHGQPHTAETRAALSQVYGSFNEAFAGLKLAA